MAPDITSLPPSSPRASMNLQSSSRSPTIDPRSRRTSTTMPLPASAAHHSEQFPSMPMRHSRPMTPAEIHLEMEKEQEAVVNRLTRELSALRAHSASVASNTSQASSNSAAIYEPPQPPPRTDTPLSTSTSPALTTSALHHPPSTQSHIVTSPIPPTSAREHRSSSSSLSSRTRSLTSSSSSFAQPPSAASIAPPPGPAPLGTTSQASVDRARDAAGASAMPPPPSAGGIAPTPLTRSRQNSLAQQSPSRPHSGVFQRSAGASPEPLSVTASSAGLGVAAPRSVPPVHGATVHSGLGLTSRLEEAAQARSGLENARAENEGLANRVKELERMVKQLRRDKEESDGSAVSGREESEDQRGRSGVRAASGETGGLSGRNVGDAAPEGLGR